MDPMLMAMIAMLGGGALSGLGGSQGEHGSTYSKNQRKTIDDILNQVRGQGGPPDISQNQNFQQGQGFLDSLFNDPDFFKNIEAPAMRQFNEQIIPGVANQFASMGSGGSLGSTAFRNQLGRESSNLATNLAANRTGMQQQGANQALQYGQQPFQNMMQMLQQAMQPTQNTYQPPSAGFFGPIAAGLSGGISQGMGQQMGQRFAGQYPGT